MYFDYSIVHGPLSLVQEPKYLLYPSQREATSRKQVPEGGNPTKTYKIIVSILFELLECLDDIIHAGVIYGSIH